VSGFSLIEVMIAVLVASVGVLGVVALQMVSLQNNRAALERVEALHLAHDMMDRIRANPGGMPAGAAYHGLEFGDGPPAAADCQAGACAPVQLVAFDQACWKCQLGSFDDAAVCRALRAAKVLPARIAQPGLPGGDGSITIDAAGVLRVTVRWLGVGRAPQSVTIASRV
jgi:type IV pilus assembly protein PilV